MAAHTTVTANKSASGAPTPCPKSCLTSWSGGAEHNEDGGDDNDAEVLVVVVGVRVDSCVAMVWLGLPQSLLVLKSVVVVSMWGDARSDDEKHCGVGGCCC